jgi:2,5-diketo-D-gluconate reductase B
MLWPEIPRMGLGTFGRRGPEGQRAIESAIEIGYRHLDTAQDYDTEAECGHALKASGLARGEMFVTTKIRLSNLGKGRLVPSLRESCESLQVDAVDLTLIHWPSPRDEVPLPVYIEQLAQARELGLTRLIGVSNFTISLINQSRAILGAGALANNQVEVHPFLQNTRLVNHCMAEGIAVTAYQPLAKATVNESEAICDIADRHGATPEQVALAFLLAKGLIVIPSSADTGRMRSNFAATDLVLGDQDIARIEALDRGGRRIDPDIAPDWD